MEFITFIEHNHKEKETFVFYLQWTGNEEALAWLYNTVEMSSSEDLDGDYSGFEMNINVKFTEEMVDQHCKLGYGCYNSMFTKVTGVCKMWTVWREKVCSMQSYNIGRWLDEHFYSGGIEDCFRAEWKETDMDPEEWDLHLAR